MFYFETAKLIAFWSAVGKNSLSQESVLWPRVILRILRVRPRLAIEPLKRAGGQALAQHVLRNPRPAVHFDRLRREQKFVFVSE
jgi:hypothetical protein